MTMRSNRANAVLRYIRRVAAAECARDLADRDLLDRFVSARDEAAYAALVRRHGPMVLRLCLRVLQHQQDAEDAFQATFLVLSRKAASLLPQESLAGWLYTVAYRIAQKTRIDAARRRKHEGRAAVTPVADPLGQITLREAYAVLDKELTRLPDKFRVPLVLCYLEGLTRDEAAQQLGLPPSTLKSRLEQARERLRARLAARGLALAGALVASIFSEGTASAALPTVLLDSTVEVAIAVAAGGTAASVVPAPVAALAEGVMKAMFMTKLKIVMAVVFALAGFGTAVRMAQVKAAGPGPESPAPASAAAALEGTRPVINDAGLRQQVQDWAWFVAKVDVGGNTIALVTRPVAGDLLFVAKPLGNEQVQGVRVIKRLDGALPEAIPPEGIRNVKVLSERVMPERSGILLHMGVTEDAQVIIDGQQGSLADVRPGMQVSVQMAQDRPAISRIDASTPGLATLQRVDVDKKTITVSVGGQEWTASLAANATVVVAGNPDSQLSDLSAGMRVSVQLGVDADKIAVTSIRASGE